MPSKERYQALSPEDKEKERQATRERDRKFRDNDPEAANRKSREYKKKHPAKSLLWTARRRAKSSGLEFTIQESDIIIPEKCPVFGIPLVPKEYSGPNARTPTPNSPTLDRIDSSKGYVKGNVWVISWRANKLKSDATLQELEQLVSAWRSKLNN